MLSVARSSRLLCALALVAIPGAAQGWIEPSPPIRPPLLFPRGTIEKVRSAAQVAVTGRVAHVTVEEWFRNAGPALDEANYLYPLPGEAVFSDFSIWQGEPAALGPAVLVAGRRVSVEIQVGGKTTWADGELAALVRAFRP
jgi:hypothetical protein